MDMFDLFRETDAQKTRESPSDADSPPIPTSDNESGLYSTPASDSLSSSTEFSSLSPAPAAAVANSLVVVVPGSVILRGGSFQLAWLSRLATSLDAVREAGTNIALVIGESPDVRAASRAAQQLSLHPNEISQAMRASSGLNASIVLRTLAQAHPQVCEELRETASVLRDGGMPVMLGSKDSFSTEARGALLAESLRAKMVLFSELDIPSNTLHHGRFSKMASEAAFKSTQQFIVDPLTALVMARSKVETLLLSDKHVSKLPGALTGDASEGTWISSGSAVPKEE